MTPIFIHGILPRSGTNFLWDLLLLHPDCAPAVDPVREDLFLDHSDHLVAFAESVQAAWDPRWGEFPSDLPTRLVGSIGDGLVSFLWTDRDRRLVSKSPSVRNLGRFFALFPTAHLLLLVRDGRSVTQSAMDTFGWDFERGARAWAEAAAEIVRFSREQADRAAQWRLVRYEDLLADLDAELTAILEFTGLDPADYDFDAARNLPVRGSSAFFGQGRAEVNWEPVQKDAGFTPVRRWEAWTPQQVARFEWLAGNQLRALGYESAPLPRRQVPARQRLLDARWTARRTGQRVRSKLGRASRPLRRRLGLVR